MIIKGEQSMKFRIGQCRKLPVRCGQARFPADSNFLWYRSSYKKIRYPWAFLLGMLLLIIFSGFSGIFPCHVQAGSGGHSKAGNKNRSIPEVYQNSYVLEAEGDYQKAWEVMCEIQEEEKSKYIYQLRIGWLTYMTGNYAASKNAYRKAVTLKPQSLEARLGLLLPLLASGNYVDVKQTAAEVLEVDPLNYLGNLRLASAFYQTGKYMNAAICYERLKSIYPGDLSIMSGLAWCKLKERNLREAKKLFYSILEVAPNYPQAREGLETAEK